MTLSVTSLYAALLGFLLVYLSVRIIRLRYQFKVAIGTGDQPAIERAVRVQANFSEYVPVALILLLLAEIQGGSPLVLHAIGLALVVGRIAHAVGLGRTPEKFRWRSLGVILTFLAIISGGIANLTILAS
jgi:uncharacterized membrane protein YecN with MAPEG domain